MHFTLYIEMFRRKHITLLSFSLLSETTDVQPPSVGLYRDNSLSNLFLLNYILCRQKKHLNVLGSDRKIYVGSELLFVMFYCLFFVTTRVWPCDKTIVNGWKKKKKNTNNLVSGQLVRQDQSAIQCFHMILCLYFN